MTPPRLLLVDDDEALASLLRDYLRLEGYQVELAHTVADGVRRVIEQPPTLVILDVMLPDGSGIDALKAVRAQCSVPVLMLTARGDPIDRIVGLELGADDYVPKPCPPRELAARVKAILRRAAQGAAGQRPAALVAGALQLAPGRRKATWAGQPLVLTSAEFAMLEALMRHVGQLVTKSTLSQEALGRPLGRFDRSVDVHISALRQKLAQASAGRCAIDNVRGRGYQLVVDE